MNDREYERNLSIVFVGNFNPKIFSPNWLLNKGLISAEQADKAKIYIIHPDVSQFTVSDCTFDIIGNRFLAKTTHVHLFEKLRDSVFKIFEILKETPIIQTGINWSRIYQFLESEEKLYIDFGHQHLPKHDFWSKVTKNPGVQSMTIRSDRPDGFKGCVNTSIKALEVPRTIELTVNDHYELRPAGFEKQQDEKMVYNANAALEILSSNFEKSREYSNHILDKVYGFGVKG